MRVKKNTGLNYLFYAVYTHLVTVNNIVYTIKYLTIRIIIFN